MTDPAPSAESEGCQSNHFVTTRKLKRFLTAPATPTRPVPRSNIVVGSGMGLLVICPWTVVIPLFEPEEQVQWIVGNGIRYAADGNRGRRETAYSCTGTTSSERPAKSSRKTIASGNWCCLINR